MATRVAERYSDRSRSTMISRSRAIPFEEISMDSAERLIFTGCERLATCLISSRIVLSDVRKTEIKSAIPTVYTAKDVRLEEHRVRSFLKVLCAGIDGRCGGARRWFVARSNGRGNNESNRVLLDRFQFGDIPKSDSTLLAGWQSADIDLNS